MKIILVSLLTVSLLCGCEKSSNLTRNSEQLEARINTLEKNLPEIRRLGESNLTSMQTNFLNAFATNRETIDKINQQLAFENSRIEFMQMVVSNLINTINQNGALASQPNSSQANPPVQIPTNVLEQIRAAAIQQFPNDVNRQNEMIKKEADAWYQLKQ